MSKFVRTKEGIYDTSKGLYTPSIKMWAIGFITIYDDQILKEADTIEELCDEFVIIYKDEYKYYANTDKPFITNNKPYTLKSRTEEKLKYFNYYGAIWTDKGLIYVAKMNEKGDLELI